MFPNLNGEMTKFNVTVDDIATVLEVAPNNVRARFRGDTNLTFGEACKIRDYFNDKYDTNFTIDYLFASEPIAV